MKIHCWVGYRQIPVCRSLKTGFIFRMKSSRLYLFLTVREIHYCKCVIKEAALSTGLQSVQLIAGGIQARKVETLGDYKLTDRIILIFVVPQMGIRKGRVRQIIVRPGFQLL